MKNTVLVAVASSLLLAACSAGRLGVMSVDPNSTREYGGYVGFLVKKPDPNLPNLFVDDNDAYIIVDQDPIYIDIKGSKKQLIVWALDSAKPYVFADPPIQITPVGTSPPLQDMECPVTNSGVNQKWLGCKYTAPGKGKYTYTLRVRNTNTNKVIVSDPTMVND